MTDTSGARPIDLLRGVVHSACWAVDLTKENRPDEAGEHIDAIERLIAAYRADGDESKRDIHTHFGLSYANYLVLPRTLLQSMPKEWQHQFVALLEQLNTAFEHVPQAEAYDVHAVTEHIVSDMTDEQLEQACIAKRWETDGEPPMSPWDEGFAEWQDAHLKAEPTFYDAAFSVLDPNDRVTLQVLDPVPHYSRGRTRVEPRLDGAE